MSRRRVFAWWVFAEGAAASLARPRTDVGTADAGVGTAIRASRLFASAERIADAAETAWHASVVRRLVNQAVSEWRECSPAAHVRAIGACAVVAAATALVLQIVESPLDGPLRWILPVCVGLLGASVAAAADPIARAWEDKRT